MELVVNWTVGSAWVGNHATIQLEYVQTVRQATKRLQNYVIKVSGEVNTFTPYLFIRNLQKLVGYIKGVPVPVPQDYACCSHSASSIIVRQEFMYWYCYHSLIVGSLSCQDNNWHRHSHTRTGI